jgi:hypothetical protein
MSLGICLATLAVILHTTRQWHYYATYTTYYNVADYGFRHDGTCRIKLVDGQLSAVRRHDDRTWLFADQASTARRGWSWGRSDARAFPGMHAGSGIWFRADRAGWGLELPLWTVVIVSLALPARLLMLRLAVTKRRAGFCANCGYDLRATPERCPECGLRPKEHSK